MSIFTSDRERRLWLWALAVTVAIYSTMGPARTLVDALRERNLLRISFALVLIVLVGAIAGRWVKKRPGWGEIGVALGVALAYLARFSGWGARRSALTLSSMASWPPSSTRRSWNECGMAAECRRLLKQLGSGRSALPSRKEAMGLLRELLETGKITPIIDSTYPLSEAREALRHMMEDETQGKVIITP